MVGVDSNGKGTDPFKGTRSDTMILVNIDPESHSINAISIPRDSKVYLAGDHGVQKINAAHALGGIELTKRTKKTWFYSRSRNELWNKGATSGNFQEVKEIWSDCDNDTLLIKVKQNGVACHTGKMSCFFRRIT